MCVPFRLVCSAVLVLISVTLTNLEAADESSAFSPGAFRSGLVFPVYLGTNLSSLREEDLAGALRQGQFAAVYHSGKKILEQRSNAPIAGMLSVAAAAMGDADLAKRLSTRAIDTKENRAELNRLNAEAILSKNEKKLDIALGKTMAAIRTDFSDPVAYLTLAWIRLEQENYAEAEKTAREALAFESNSGPAHTVLGAALYATGRHPEALKEYFTARQADPFDLRARFGIAEVLFAMGNFEESLRQIKEVQKFSRNLLQANILASRALMELGASAEAITEARNALAQDPRSLTLSFLLATAYARNNQISEALKTVNETHAQGNAVILVQVSLWRIAAGQWPQAKSILEKLVQQSPADLALHPPMGVLEQRLGDTREAEKWFDACLFSTNSAFLEQIHFHLANVELATKNWLKAKQELADSGGYLRNAKMEQLDLARLCATTPPESFADLNVTALLLNQNLRKAALSVLEKSIQNSAGNFLSLYLLSHLYLRENQLDRALASVDQLLKIIPDYSPGHFIAGDVLAKKKAPTDAIASYEKCVQFDPTNGTAYLRLGALYQSLHNSPKAIENYKRAAQLMPNSPAAFNELAFLLSSDGKRLDEALTAAKTALSLAPENPTILDTVGWVQYKQKRPAEALVRFQEAAALAGSNPNLHAAVLFHSALANEALGRAKEAAVSARKALAISSDFSEAGDAKALLKRLDVP
jgi:tetratricopeptide (TPR) repeat protein